MIFNANVFSTNCAAPSSPDDFSFSFTLGADFKKAVDGDELYFADGDVRLIYCMATVSDNTWRPADGAELDAKLTSDPIDCYKGV